MRGLFALIVLIYPVDMDILPVLKTGKLIVLYSSHAAREESMRLIAELGLRGPVTILDGGNRYKPYQVAMLIRRKTVEVNAVANRLHLLRDEHALGDNAIRFSPLCDPGSVAHLLR